MTQFWHKHRESIRSLVSTRRDEVVHTWRYTASYDDDLARVFHVLDSVPLPTPP
jgi:hypothetical protein